jgi:hypothetical protein
MIMHRLEEATVRIASRKLGPAQPGGKIEGPRLGTGGGFSGIFFWDTAFTSIWARYHRDVLPVERSLDNLYRLQDAEGFINREYSADGEPCWPRQHPIAFAPPVLSWAEREWFALSGDRARLARVYPRLKAHHDFCARHFSRGDGLYIGDALGSGMDNLPRWPRDYTGKADGLSIDVSATHPTVRAWFEQDVRDTPGGNWNEQGRFIDMSAQMAFDALCLARIAEEIGEDPSAHLQEHAQLGETINALCWNEAHQFYFDLAYGEQLPRFHIGAYWVLLAELVPQERMGGLIAHLEDPERFGRPVPVPCLSADDPDYEAKGAYWRGASWPPTTYMVLRGLRTVGYEALARRLARRYVGAVETLFEQTGTFWENLSPEAVKPGDPAGPDFLGWAGLGPVAIRREFLV